MRRLIPLVSLMAVMTAGVGAQTRVTPESTPVVHPNSGAVPQTGVPTSPGAAVDAPADYALGGGDTLQVDVPDLADEFTPDKTFRIEGGGDLGLPIIGHVQAAGLTVAQLEEAIKAKLKRIVKEPDVVVTVMAFGSQPVSVLGSVLTPGIIQIGGRKNLFDVLSMAGGLADDAGYKVTITRDLKWGTLPLANSHVDDTGQYSVGWVKVKDLMNFSNTAENISILPGDKIAVPISERVYAVGNVTKPGGFLLNQHESLSALQVVSLAEGFNKTAAPQRAKILRAVLGSPNRSEIPINLKALMQGKAEDFQLQPDDILFVPNSGAKSAGYDALTAVTAATGALIYTAR